MDQIRQALPFLSSELLDSISENSDIQEVPKGVQLLKPDQYIKEIPVVLNGLVKVSTQFDDRELLLYYIKQGETCAMSFSAIVKQKPCVISATTEENARLLLLPAGKIRFWLKTFPEFNTLFYEQYDLRYTELLETIQHILLNKMDKRLYDYLKQKSNLTNNETLKLSHTQIANELGTVREVVSRVIKKLETEGAVSQTPNGIKINN